MQTQLFYLEDNEVEEENKEIKPEVKHETKSSEILSVHERFMIQKYGEDWKHNEHFIKKRRHR